MQRNKKYKNGKNLGTGLKDFRTLHNGTERKINKQTQNAMVMNYRVRLLSNISMCILYKIASCHSVVLSGSSAAYLAIAPVK
jgi:hypothetical protein